MRVLLVDDDAFLRDMYETKFTQESAEVTAVSTGRDALESLKEKTFDVVITDMIMPGMSGLELFKEIRRIQPKSKMKFVVLSNQGESSDKEAAAAVGIDGYIVKAELIPSEVVQEVFSIVSK